MRSRLSAIARMSSTGSEVDVRWTRVGADGQRHVDAVVDDQEGPAVERERAEPAAQEGEVGGAEVLLAHLDSRQAGREALANDRGEVAAARLAFGQ